jgi:hypothetical protein
MKPREVNQVWQTLRRTMENQRNLIIQEVEKKARIIHFIIKKKLILIIMERKLRRRLIDQMILNLSSLLMLFKESLINVLKEEREDSLV